MVDERQYQVPAIVQNYYQTIVANEMSVCFTPIIPTSTAKTHSQVTVLPGHHGTPSGNLRTQLGYCAYTHEETEVIYHVQKVTIYYLYDFLKKHHAVLMLAAVPAEEKDLLSLESVWNTYSSVKGDDRIRLMVQSYDILAKNIQLFEKFNAHTYFYFRIFGKHWAQRLDQRTVHVHKRSSSEYLSAIPFLAIGPYNSCPRAYPIK